MDEIELQQLLAAVEPDGRVKSLRDLAMLCIMALQGARSIEVHRANVGDIIRVGNNLGLRVEGKRSIRVIPLRPDVAQVLKDYLEARRSSGERVTANTPLFVATGNRAGGQRLARRGIRAIVDEYLHKVGLKYAEGRTLSAHSLRHTAGTLSLRSGASLRQVQDLLGHKDPQTTAIYAHAADRFENNPALGIAVTVPN